MMNKFEKTMYYYKCSAIYGWLIGSHKWFVEMSEEELMIVLDYVHIINERAEKLAKKRALKEKEREFLETLNKDAESAHQWLIYRIKK